MFSTLGLIMNSKRSSLNPVTMNMISFIHDNMKLVRDLVQKVDEAGISGINTEMRMGLANTEDSE